MSRPPLEAARRFEEERGWEILASFARLLQIPNVTGKPDGLRANARELVSRFQARGALLETVELEGAGPLVVGQLRAQRPTATIGVYAHYDGQPVDPNRWAHEPFSATLLSGPLHEGAVALDYPRAGEHIDPEWRIYARGASDDKAPFAALGAALDALELANIERTVDLVFLFEGEEESGSPNLARYMTELAPRLQADAWLLCDGPVHQSRSPQIGFGARGYSGFDLTVYGPERELHSGHYGNWVPNPAMELASLLAGCKDSNGMVTIDGFYDDTAPISAADRRAIAALPSVEAHLQDELGFGGSETSGSTYAERLMLPSFNVRGLSAGAVGKEPRNVIPSEATASVDMRLAAGDDPQTMIERFAAHLVGSGYHVLDRDPLPEERRRYRRLAKLTPTTAYRAARIPSDSPLAEILVGACERASGGERIVALPTFGGSIPLYLFEDLLGAPAAVLPIANHDNNQHAPNENIRIANLWYGIDLWATLLTTDFSAIRRSRP